MSDPFKKKELSQVLEESAVVGLRSDIAQVQSESQIFQQKLVEYNQRTATLGLEPGLTDLSKRLKQDFFQLLGRVVEMLEAINANVS